MSCPHLVNFLPFSRDTGKQPVTIGFAVHRLQAPDLEAQWL